MSLLFFDSFDHYAIGDIAKKWTGGVVNSPAHSIVYGGGRRGTNCYRWTSLVTSGTRYTISPTWTATSKIFMGFALKITNFDSFGDWSLVAATLSSTGSTESHLAWVRGGNNIRYHRNGAVQTGTFAFQTNVWYWIEIEAYFHNTSGYYKLWVDGKQDLNYSGDTVATTANCNRVFFGGNVNSTEYDLDDFYICDDQGSVNNSLLGEITIDSLFPTGVGNTTDWTSSAGNNWECVDEATPNTTDYVYTTVSGNKDLYSYEDLSLTANIKGIQQLAYAKKSDTGTANLRQVFRPSSTDYPLELFPLNTSYIYEVGIVELNPETSSPWTVSGINNLESGFLLEI